MASFYTIFLFGTFDVKDDRGISKVPVGSKECALIAVLALSPNFRRSREWLKALLWSDRSEQQAGGSLRQCIWKLRQLLPNNLVQADSRNVWLDASMFCISDPLNEQQLELLEGILVRDEAFEEWLRIQRSRIQTANILTSQLQDTLFTSIPNVVVCGYVYNGCSPEARFLSAFIYDEIVGQLKSSGLVDLFDACNFSKNQGTGLAHPKATNDALFKMHVTESRYRIWIEFQVVELGTGRILGKKGKALNTEAKTGPSCDECAELISEVSSTVELAAYMTTRIKTEDQNLFKAVHQLMSHSLEGQKYARKYLNRLRSQRSHAVATAWHAFSYAVGIGERYELGNADFFSQATMLCQEAIDTEPSNGVVRSIVGHVYAFVFRDLDTASEQQKIARELAPTSPTVWDFSSMTALYIGDSTIAYQYAQNAARLGKFSVFKPYYDASVMMCSAATGRNDEAIKVGIGVLKQIPNLLPVMRHLVGSFAALKEIGSARRMAFEVAKKDPEFSVERIGDPNYPIIAPDSISLLKNGFASMNLTRADQI